MNPVHQYRRPVRSQKCKVQTIVIAKTPMIYADARLLPPASSAIIGAITSAEVITTGSIIGIHIIAYHYSADTGCFRHIQRPTLTISRRYDRFHRACCRTYCPQFSGAIVVASA